MYMYIANNKMEITVEITWYNKRGERVSQYRIILLLKVS